MFSVSTGQYTMLGRFLVQPVLVDALHHADHLAPCVLIKRGKPDTSTERGRGLRRELASEILGDHDHAAARLDVAPSEVASRDESRAHGFEIAGRDELESALRRR